MSWLILVAALTASSLLAAHAEDQEVDGFFNVAFKRTATQSTTAHGGTADKAVDGSTDQTWRGRSGSCTFSQKRGSDTWSVDLGRVYQIDHIRVWGFDNGWSSFMADTMLWVDSNLCGRMSDVKKDGPEHVKCDSAELMAGRKITIKAGASHLGLCEVQVMVKKEDIEKVPETVAWPGERVGGFTNLAFKEDSKAKQSSTIHRGDAERANDGNRNGHWGGGSVTHTNGRGLQYWEVDLGRVYKIHHITIYGRTDCCSERIQGARVIAGKSQVGSFIQKPEKPTDPINIDLSERKEPVLGRKVKVELLNNYLSLAEVEVWVANEDVFEAAGPTLGAPVGQEIDEFINVAYNKEATQTSENQGASADKAVDGWTAQDWRGKDGSCVFTRNRGTDIWKVDLGRVYQIDHIRVWGFNNQWSSFMVGTKLWVDRNLCGRMRDMKKSGPEIVKCDDPKLMAGRHIAIAAGSTHLGICEVQVMVKKADIEKVPDTVTWPGEKTEGFTNVALNHIAVNEKSTATQSSTIHGGEARRANDGNRDGHWGSASVTHTDGRGQQYWQVDLGRVYKIHHITIYGRTDCCSERIQGARVMVGQSQVGPNLAKPAKPTDPIKIDLSEREEAVYGKKVSVQLMNNYLSLGEVEVWVANEDVLEEAGPTLSAPLGQEVDEFINVAYNKKATQTSENHGASADKAVDGWTTQDWRGKDGSCTFTRNQGTDIWKVDLGKVYQIDHIRVWGFNNQWSSFMVGTMLWVDNNMCGRMRDMKQSGPEHVKCDDPKLMAGRYITIAAGFNHLGICEVQVMVKKADLEKVPETVTWPGERTEDFTNVALNHVAINEESTATQSSTIHNGVARKANDGKIEGHWGKGSVTHTDGRGHQYWQVDLGRVYKIHHITIYGRTDCCSERIQGARVVVGKSLQVATNLQKPAKPSDPIKIDLSEEDVFGRKVTIELIQNYLSLAEVQVWVANGDVFGDEPPTVVPTLENVAVKRVAKQSSTWNHHGPDRAVDNFPTYLNPNQGSCSHTEKQPLNFWEVDLGKEYFIDHIKVLGRNDNDGSAKRINGATILVDGRTVGGFVYQNQNQEFVFPLNGLKGRTVRISRNNEYLTLCEVQVIVNHEFEPDDSNVEPIEQSQPNLASSAKASSSSVLYSSAGLATDGNVESNFYRGSCFLSGPAANSNWVKLELAQQTKIGSVAVYPRLDYNAYDAIHDAEVRAGEYKCGAISYESGKLFYQIDCDGQAASEITISKVGFLSLCEVVVHAAS